MNKVKQTLALLLITLSVVHGLKCYNCASSESLDECTPHEQVEECSPEFDRCYQGEISYMVNSQLVKTYNKGCTTAAQCSDDENLTCKNVKDSGVKNVKCHIECCTGNTCNSSATTAIKVSVFMVLSCAVSVLSYLNV